MSGAGGLLVGRDVLVQLDRHAVELVEDRGLVVLHAGGLVEQPDHGDLVVREVAEDLAGDLVERRADLLGPADRVAAELAAAVEVDRRHGGEELERRLLHPLKFADRGRLDPPAAPAADPGGGGGGEPAGHDRAAAVAGAAAVVGENLHRRGRRLGLLVADRLVAGDVLGIGVNRQRLALAVAEAGQRGVELDRLVGRVGAGERRRRQRREDHEVDDQRHAPGRHQMLEPGPPPPPRPKLAHPGRCGGGRIRVRVRIRFGRRSGGGGLGRRGCTTPAGWPFLRASAGPGARGRPAATRERAEGRR